MLLAIDTETHLMGPAQMAPRLVCLSWCNKNGSGIVDRKGSFLAIEGALRRDDTIVGCNIAYDMAVLAAAYPSLLPVILQAYDNDRVRDVALDLRLNDLAGGKLVASYSLATLTWRVLNIQLPKEDTWRLRYEELDGVPLAEWPAEATQYAKKDAEMTYLLAEKICTSTDSYRQARAAFSAHLASVWGMRTDLVAVEKLEASTTEELEAHKSRLIGEGLLSEKGNRKIKPTRERMLKAMGGELYQCKLTAKGQISIDRESCEKSGDPALQTYARYSKLQSLLSGAIKDYREGTELPIHTRFEVLLNTGRMSSQKPNLQNIRREPGVRECFIPRHGNVYLAADVDRAELHTLAQVCKWKVGFSELGTRLNAGEDPHLTMGARMVGLTPEKALERFEQGDEGIAKARQAAKPANFGFPGGMGPQGMVEYSQGYGVDLSLQEAQGLYDVWRSTWPCIVKYLDWIGACTRVHGTMNVEQCMSGRVRGDTSYCAAANSYFQGLAADAVKACMWEITKRTYNDPNSALYGARLVNVIHDEFLLEVGEDRAAQAGDELAALVVEHYSKWTPDYPISCSPVLMRRWSKAAKTLRDENGVLGVWEEKKDACDGS